MCNRNSFLRIKFFAIAITASLLISFYGCLKQGSEQPMAAAKSAPDITKAIAVITPTEGSKAKGTVTFTLADNAIKVVADVEGLTPGKHGFHIHQYGDISSADGSSLGGHFNPDSIKHGSPDVMPHHAGDFGNLVAGKDGKAHLELTDSLITFSGPHSILGRGIVIHGGEDDMMSQPAGNSGPRVGVGVIGIAKP